MMKLVRITDIKSFEIFPGRKTRGPVSMRMDNETIRRLINQLDGPKGIYAVSKDNKTIRLTSKNYMLSEEELFSGIKELKVEKVVETKEYKDAAPKVDTKPIEKTETKVEKVVETPVEDKKEDKVDKPNLDSLKSSLQDLKTSETKVETSVDEKKEEKPYNNKKYNNYKK